MVGDVVGDGMLQIKLGSVRLVAKGRYLNWNSIPLMPQRVNDTCEV